MRIFAVSGFCKTGKTTTVTALIHEFKKRGYSVGTLKDSHCGDLVLDSPGTDTYKHSEAGAEQVTLCGLWGTMVIYKKRQSLEEILAHYKQDIVILEGFSKWDLPRIVTAKEPSDICAKLTPKTFAIAGVIAGAQKTSNGLPVINGLNKADELCDLILKVVKDNKKDHLPNLYKQVI